MLLTRNQVIRGWMVAGMVVCFAVLSADHAWAQKAKKATADASAAAAKAERKGGRLPPHFKDLVTADQRDKIYEIQAEYAPKIAELHKQLQQLMQEQQTKIEAQLTAEQKQKLEALKTASKGKRSGKTVDVQGKETPAEKKAVAPGAEAAGK